MSTKLDEERVEIRIRDAPVSLRNRFKSICSSEGLTYREMLKKLLDKVYPEVKWR